MMDEYEKEVRENPPSIAKVVGTMSEEELICYLDKGNLRDAYWVLIELEENEMFEYCILVDKYINLKNGL